MDDFLTEHDLTDFVADYKSDDVKAVYTLVLSMCRYCLSRRLLAGKQLCHLHNMSVILDEKTAEGPEKSLETLSAEKAEKLPNWFRTTLRNTVEESGSDYEADESEESSGSESEPEEKEHKREPERKRSSRSQGAAEPMEVGTSSDDDEVEGDEEEDADPDYAVEDRDDYSHLDMPIPARLPH